MKKITRSAVSKWSGSGDDLAWIPDKGITVFQVIESTEIQARTKAWCLLRDAVIGREMARGVLFDFAQKVCDIEGYHPTEVKNTFDILRRLNVGHQEYGNRAIQELQDLFRRLPNDRKGSSDGGVSWIVSSCLRETTGKSVNIFLNAFKKYFLTKPITVEYDDHTETYTLAERIGPGKERELLEPRCIGVFPVTGDDAEDANCELDMYMHTLDIGLVQHVEFLLAKQMTSSEINKSFPKHKEFLHDWVAGKYHITWYP